MSVKQKFECAACGKDVWQYPQKLNGKTVHCSRACYAQTQRSRSPHNKGISRPATKLCAQCGASMIGMPSAVARRKYCSIVCTASALSNDPETILSRYRVDGGCWVWQGAKRGGYGRVKLAGKTQEAHRVSYEFHIGHIPDGLVLDHLCRNRACINPAHLEPVTQEENIRRGDQGSPEAMRRHWATRRGSRNADCGGRQRSE